jgi:hypothetical protein
MVNAELRKLETNWEELLSGKITILPDPFAGLVQPVAPAPEDTRFAQAPRPRPGPSKGPQFYTSTASPSSYRSAPQWKPSRVKPQPRPINPSPPPSPKVSIKYGHTPQEADQIVAYIQVLSTRRKQGTLIRLNDIIARYQQQGYLEFTDFDWLRFEATKNAAAASQL